MNSLFVKLSWVALLCHVGVGFPAAGQPGVVEEILVIEKRPSGGWSHMTMDSYCARFGTNAPPWCPGGTTTVGGPGEQDYSGVQTCTGTDNVTANCRCVGSTPQKVYSATAGTFHCRAEPPNAPCSQWDQAFSYNPDVWQCAVRPFDADAANLAQRVATAARPRSVATGTTPFFPWATAGRPASITTGKSRATRPGTNRRPMFR